MEKSTNNSDTPGPGEAAGPRRELICDRVILAVCGAVGATEVPQLIVLLRREFCRSVNVLMTAGAECFLTPFTAQVFSDNPVTRSTAGCAPGFRGGNVEPSLSADILLVAPATANMISKLACGLADDPVSSRVLAETCPKVLAPAMNVQMWKHPAIQRNIATLKAMGFYVIDPELGVEVATMEVSYGSMPHSRAIARFLFDVLAANSR